MGLESGGVIEYLFEFEPFNQGCEIKTRIELGEWILVISAMDWEHSIIIMC